MFSIVDEDEDNDSLPQHGLSITFPIPAKLPKPPTIVGSSQGLLCIYNYDEKTGDSVTKNFVLWNLSIRKSVAIIVPNVSHWPFETVIGFGVCCAQNSSVILGFLENDFHSWRYFCLITEK